VFDKFPVRIGRSSLNDIVLEDPTASSFHALIERDGDTLLLIDLGSRNGIISDGKRIEAQGRFDLSANACTFAIARYSFRAWRVAEAASPPDTRALLAGVVRGVTLLLQEFSPSDIDEQLCHEGLHLRRALADLGATTSQSRGRTRVVCISLRDQPAARGF